MNYWKLRGIQSLTPELPYGNIKDLIFMKKTLGQHYNNIYWKFKKEPFGGIYQFWKPALMIRDPEVIKSVFVKDFQCFHDNHYFVNPEVDPILGLNPFNTKGDKWPKARKVITLSITPLKIKSMLPQMQDACYEMVNYLNNTKEDYLEAHDMMGKYSTDIVGSCAYGIQSNSFKDPNSALRQVSKSMFDGTYRGNIALLCALYAPKLGNILRYKLLTDEANKYFVGFVRDMSKYRVENGIQRNDFLQSLINANQEAIALTNAPIYSDVELAAHCMTFFLDGFETTAILLSFLAYELSLNKDVQNHLRQEILQTSKKFEDFNYDTIHSIKYLHMLLMEGLRKHPPGTTMSRTCTKSTILKSSDKQVEVEKGVPVILPMYSIHNDPKYFPNPEIFDPLRFTEENIKKRPLFAHFPFGGGPRVCPGQKFALTMIKLGIISLLMNFELTPKETSKGKIEYNPKKSFFHTSMNGIWIKYTPIKHV